MIGFRVWQLKAYDKDGNCVACVSEDMGTNRKKFRAFLGAVADVGYTLSPGQVRSISDDLLLDLPSFDNTYLPRIYAVQANRFLPKSGVHSAVEGETLSISPRDAAIEICKITNVAWD
jgi:hypothetical protein